MRLWSLHPKYLDTKGLVALWREALLAQAVLKGQTRGYVHHPQLVRFRAQESSTAAIAEYLRSIHVESSCRGYAFDPARISGAAFRTRIPVTRGQIETEWNHLMRKLAARDPERMERLRNVKRPSPHPLFRVVPGPVESWESVGSQPARS